MRKYLIFATIGIFVLGSILFTGFAPASASPNYQLTPFPTPTPRGDGQIWYLVQSGDTLWRISAVTGVSLDELRRLNNMAPDDVLVEGGYILLGQIQQAVPTSTPSNGTPEEIAVPTETPIEDTGSATICVVLYDDLNGDSLRQDTEGIVEGGAVSITEQTGLFSETRNTSANEDEYCFSELPGGKYNITMAIPNDYNPTSELTLTLEILTGDSSLINFGAQESYQPVTDDSETVTEEGSKSPILGIVGLTILLIGIGLAIFTSQIGRRQG